MAASSALREFIRLPILGLQRMPPMAGRTAASQSYAEGPVWAEVVIWQNSMGIELTSSLVKVLVVCCTAAGICSPNVLSLVFRRAERRKQSKE
jgi:hypothetical protein